MDVEVPSAVVAGKEFTLELKGFFTDGCHKGDYAEAYVDDDIIKIYPNALKKTGNNICTDNLVPFQTNVVVDKLVPGRYLVWLMDTDSNYKTEKVLEVLRNEVEFARNNENR